MQKNISSQRLPKKKKKTTIYKKEANLQTSGQIHQVWDPKPKTNQTRCQQRRQAADHLSSPHPQKRDYDAPSKDTMSNTMKSNSRYRTSISPTNSSQKDLSPY